jgi:L-alanine-DL-glutamate epimerase-like enolase superfamily enzyme
MRAIGAVDIALWDRNARAAGIPLYSYLGAHAERSAGVPAYASGGYYIEGKTVDGLAEEVAGHVEAGFSAVKIKVGRLSARDDAARVEAARAAIGPDVLLMLDANNAWRDLPSALEHVRRYEEFDPYWIEEPFTPDDIHSHARLAERTSITVATGEVEAGRWRHLELLRSGAAGILQTDAAVCGGITEWRRIAHAASCFGVSMSPHWFHDLHVHLVAASDNGEFVELFVDDSVLNFRYLLDRQLEAVGGRLPLPTEPGLGFEFDDDAVAKFALTGWTIVA